jgi:purine-binding chemotaxis protein CheW
MDPMITVDEPKNRSHLRTTTGLGNVKPSRKEITMVEGEDSTMLSDELQLVSFNLGDEEFGIEILKVREINRMLTITHVPNTPAFVEGIVNLRGKVIPIIDLRCRFGLERRTYDKDTRIVVVELSGKILGFIVDAVKEVLRIPRTSTERPPKITGAPSEDYITGVAKLGDRLLILLELEKAIDTESMTNVAAVA